jgi:hypothetical protein
VNEMTDVKNSHQKESTKQTNQTTFNFKLSVSIKNLQNMKLYKNTNEKMKNVFSFGFQIVEI